MFFIFAYRSLEKISANSENASGEIEFIRDSVHYPEATGVEVIHQKHYSLGYSEQFEQPLWVFYKLTRESLRIPNVPRSDWFETDHKVSTQSARHSDYSGSGYSRGHLVPAGDMAFDRQAMQESFFMSNMSPQLSGFNGGIWRELEESVRDWAYENDEVYVASGPIFGNVAQYIGKQSEIGVPEAFYKVVLDVYGDGKKAIGFIVPHEVSTAHLSNFSVSIDEVERQTGIDFFDNLYANKAEENSMEERFDLALWPFSEQRFQTRIQSWNKN